jgi:hypothetical protein
MAFIGIGCLLLIPAIVVGIALRALVLAYTWTWFIVPILHVPQISPVEAVGFSIFASAIFSAAWRGDQYKSRDKQEISELVWESLGITVLAPLLVLGVAWGSHLVMLSDQTTWPSWLQRINEAGP